MAWGAGSSETRHVAIGGLMVFTAAIALVLGLRSMFGIHGFGAGLYLVAACWCFISWTNATSLRPFSCRPMNPVEVCTVFVLCGLMHGLMVPAVTSIPRPRRLVPVGVIQGPVQIPSSVAPTTPNAGFSVGVGALTVSGMAKRHNGEGRKD